MTLAAVIVPFLALCVAARSIAFLPALGIMTAVAMLIDGLTPLQEAGAAFAVILGVGPVLFLNFYQYDEVRERKVIAAPFLLPGVMILLMLMNLYPDGTVFPAGICVVMAGLVTVSVRQTMVWQWAGLLTCAEGVLLSAVMYRQVTAFAVTALIGCCIAILGGACVHRVMPRVHVVRAPVRQERKNKKWQRSQQDDGDALDHAAGAPHPDYVPQRSGASDRGPAS
ncbi:hypothetical protein [Acetobacter thailandicus]|uniref:Uncharacterized protein n=1 Tax=Acetobacter thailandicus TaxID=1502842 RepID=A0ABT3QEU5_9PROT|nr:hypothetical protein [Acetobacter thailandicus]MCX2563817.1 hypothetical protein [Acetobacter thailandicus]